MILQRGLAELLQITQGLEFRPIVSARFPLPLALAVYGETPDPERVRADVRARIETDPLSLLEVGLVLLELYACNQPGVSASVPDDDAFLTQVFASKRMSGWIVLLGVSIYLLVFFSRVVLLVLAFVYMFSGVIARLAYSWRRHHPPARNPLPSSQGPIA